MPVHFPRTHYVIRRGKGGYIDGRWMGATEGAADPVQMNIQPASVGDYQRMEATPGGRRYSAMLRAYADRAAGLREAGKDGYPGDIVLYNDARWLVIGSAVRDVFGGGDTAHIRYILALEAEHSPGEVTA